MEKKRAFQCCKEFKESIRFENVDSRIESEGEVRPVLHGIDLEVSAARWSRLVGPSGAGKSSLVNLIPRFFDVTGGRILIDGHDVRDVTFASLRKQIGKVTQETILFNDTRAQQHRVWTAGHAVGKVQEAAQMALAHDFILRMPDGYDTDHRREGRSAVRRRAAAAGDCAGDLEERADPDPG